MAKKKQTREERLAEMCKTLNQGDFGGDNNDAVTWLGSRQVKKIERLPSGCYELDDALGGGWPEGRFIEIYGPESGGKTTTCLHALANFQKKYPDDDCALIDTEYSFDEEYAAAVGVKTKWLLVHQPDDGNQALNILEEMIKLGVRCIVVDSVAALIPKGELEGNLGDTKVAEQARLMSQSLRRLTAEAGKRGATVFWTNQMRDKIGVTYGDKTTTPAGRALKHYASVRVAIRRSGTEREKVNGKDVAIANRTKADVKKNKTAPPFRTADFYITYGIGIDSLISMFDKAIELKIISKRGGWYSYEEENIAQGRYNSLERLRTDEELYLEIEKEVTETLKKQPEPEKEPEKKSKVPDKVKKEKEKAEFDDDVIDVDSEVVEVEDV